MPEHPDTLIWVAGVKPALAVSSQLQKNQGFTLMRNNTRWVESLWFLTLYNH